MTTAREMRTTLDDDGFLVDPACWSQALAGELAARCGIVQLDEGHWKVLAYLREHYLTNGTIPAEHNLCRHMRLEPHCIEKLFAGDLLCAWRIAGLPNPGEEAKSYALH